MDEVTMEYESIQTIAYTHTIVVDPEEWEAMFGEPFDKDSVTIGELRDYAEYNIEETGGDILEEVFDNLREVD